MRKLFKILIVVSMAFALFGCNTNTTNQGENTDFAQFIEELPARLIDSNGFNLNYVFNDPSAFGIDKEVGSIEAYTLDEFDESIGETKELLTELEAFDYDALSVEQQLDYRVLEEYLQRQLLLEDYGYFNNNYLGSFLGMQAQLPVLLLEFQLNDAQDLETYLQVLQTAPEAFKGYVDNERIRQVQGVGMSQVLLDGVIEQCENFANGDVTFLVEAMNEKIDNADFLSDAEKEQAKLDNESFTQNEFKNAYVVLKEELQSITPEMEDGGIAQQPNGQEYYQALFQYRCGLDWTIEELEDFLDEKEDMYISILLQKLMRDPNLQTSMFEQDYGHFESVEDTIDYLADAYTEYFPDVGTFPFRVEQVPESMKENFSPAAYLTSRIDRREDEALLILINGGHDDTNFTTIAHESYPGHLYQDNYFQQLDVSTFRYLLSCIGYTEGWATYIEGQAHWFTTEDNADALEALQINQKISYAIMAKWDILINYHGISREEFKSEIESVFGEGLLNDEEVNDQYNILLENPTNYLMYFVNGLYFTDLYLEAEEALGSDFDPIAFHKVLLDIGPVGMTLLAEQVEAYIEENE